MSSSTDARHGDLWTEAVRALGIRAAGAQSPFRDLETRDDALNMIRECATALLLVGLVQIALAWVIGVGTAADAAVYMPVAVLLYRFNNRLAALLLLTFSIFSVAVIDAGYLLGVEASSDLILVAVLLWASVRSVEATGILRVGTSPPESSPQLAALGSRKGTREGKPSTRLSSKTAWLAFATIAFAFAAAPRFLPPFAVPQDAATGVPPASSTSASATRAETRAVTKPDPDGHLVLRAPSGLMDPRSQEPDIATMVEGFVPPAMELAALFVSASDLEAFRQKRRFAPAQYVMIQAVRRPSSDHVSQEDLLAAKAPPIATSAERLGRLMGADIALSQWLGAVVRPAGDGSVDLDGARVQSRGVVYETDRSISFASIVEVPAAPAAKAATSRVVVTSLVLARGKVLVVYTHGNHAKPDDVSSARDITRDVVRNVVDDNPA